MSIEYQNITIDGIEYPGPEPGIEENPHRVRNVVTLSSGEVRITDRGLDWVDLTFTMNLPKQQRNTFVSWYNQNPCKKFTLTTHTGVIYEDCSLIEFPGFSKSAGQRYTSTITIRGTKVDITTTTLEPVTTTSQE